jgi:peptidoglycan/xylan/chitin deacetylase (PgdA/CDA1 family)
VNGSAWLRPVAAALDAAEAPCPFFFRDDDAGWADDRLLALLDRFEAHGLPVDVAAIPAELTPGLARQLAGRAKAAGVRLHQHGWEHVNHEPVGRKCEFGGSRDAAAQAGDVAAGTARLAALLGDLVDPVFTPPWNRCTPTTADVLAGQGFAVLSRDVSAGTVGRPGLAEVPVTVDWFGGRKGVRWTRGELAGRLAAGVEAGGPVGVMLHHAVTDAAELAAVDELLALVAATPAAEPATILELAG